jgi:hypothetical protein
VLRLTKPDNTYLSKLTTISKETLWISCRMIQHGTENKQVLKGINQPLLCDKELVIIMSGDEYNTVISLKTLKETISFKNWSDLVQEP